MGKWLIRKPEPTYIRGKCVTCETKLQKPTGSYSKNGQKTYKSECSYCLKKRHPDGIKRNYKNVRKYNLYIKYNITEEEYMILWKAQNGLCAICREPESSKDPKTGQLRNLAVDHDHKTGIIRGLLCIHCNMALGLMKDNTSTLSNAIQYLNLYKIKDLISK